MSGKLVHRTVQVRTSKSRFRRRRISWQTKRVSHCGCSGRVLNRRVGHVITPLRSSQERRRRKNGRVHVRPLARHIRREVVDGRRTRVWTMLIDAVGWRLLNMGCSRSDLGAGTVAVRVAIRDRSRRGLRSAKSYELRTKFPLVFLLASTIPVQPDAVVAGFALSLTIGACRFLLSTDGLSASANIWEE